MSSESVSESNSNSKREYVVVARRYRPQSFEDLVGQNQVSQALGNAITSNRVGHAYLFTGARGVGKTSTARILAKALNCKQGPTPTPCNQCDICQSVSRGEDVDVLEIDGASNRGIDEIRQLRSNVNIRPSRARFKIYIIDEVHMLTTQAFNALLKTLEEPPEHVKFIFCTTDPEKIPITVLSRCQRFDFPPVEMPAILERLRLIVETEGIEADEDALQLLARRAAGSMRDSQSLLEQLLSFCSERITTSDVHAMLGTAQSGRLEQVVAQLIARDAGAALQEVDRAVLEGVDVGQLAEQLIGYFRDMMAAAVGCPADLMLACSETDYPSVVDAAKRMGLETIMAVLQILDQSIARMRQSTQVRTLLELAIVRICNLEQLDELSELIGQLRSGAVASTRPAAPAGSRKPSPAAASGSRGQKKNENSPQPTSPVAVESRPHAIVESDSVESVWKQALAELEDMTSDYASYYAGIAISAPNRLVVSFKRGYTLQKERCERPERKSQIEAALSRITGRQMRVDFDFVAEPQAADPAPKARPSLRQRRKELEKHPLVQEAIELFDAEVTRIEEPPRKPE